jgi:hypothetical protein
VSQTAFATHYCRSVAQAFRSRDRRAREAIGLVVEVIR